eukprot:COSAG02_NODE_969_length_15565_cov_9.614833_2_plen_56_part_00
MTPGDSSCNRLVVSSGGCDICFEGALSMTSSLCYFQRRMSTRPTRIYMSYCNSIY